MVHGPLVPFMIIINLLGGGGGRRRKMFGWVGRREKNRSRKEVGSMNPEGKTVRNTIMKYTVTG